MLKVLRVGILTKLEGGLWAKSNSKVLNFSPSAERRDFGTGDAICSISYDDPR